MAELHFKASVAKRIADPKDSMTEELARQLGELDPKSVYARRGFGERSHNVVAEIPEDGIALTDLEPSQFALIIGEDVKTGEQSGVYAIPDGKKLGFYYASTEKAEKSE